MREKFRVSIEKQDHFGRGITHVDEKVVFVNKALKDEICHIEIVKSKKNFSIAEIKKLISPSKNRIQSLCPYYDKCGGCQLLHQEYINQLNFKQTKVCEIVTKTLGIEKDKVLPILGSENYNYRNKVVLHINNQKMGFYEEKSNRLIDIETCLLLDKKILEIIKYLRSYIKDNYGLTEAIIRTGDGVLLSIKGKSDKEKLITFFKDKVATLIYNEEVMFGSGVIVEKLFDKSFELASPAFFQINKYQTERLYQIVIDSIKKKKSKNVLDLYCGTGTIGILVSPYVDRVIGIEVVDEAIVNAKRNKEINNITNISFYTGKVEERLNFLTNEVDTIITDPPRSGMKKDVIDTILKIKPKNIIYVSCDPMTLARDLKLLKEKYKIDFIQPVDMFPNTYHVECVTLLVMKNH